MSLLQNQLLGIENGTLLNELHNTDENYMDKSLYSQLQLQSDAEPVRILPKQDALVGDQLVSPDPQNQLNDI